MKRAGHQIRFVQLGLLVAPLVVATAAFAVPPGDTEPNEVVDLRDLLAIRNTFGQTGTPAFVGADLDSNGVVDNGDLLIWRQNFPFIGSVLSPFVFIAGPLNGSLIGDRRPTVVIDYGPTSLNVDPNTLQVVVDGVDLSSNALRSFTNAFVPIDQPLVDGPHSVEVFIDDTQGTTGSDRSDFVVTTITLLPSAFPRSGSAPLTSTFFPDVVWADDPPSQYLWDWDNDGTWDNGCIGCFDTSARPDPLQQTFLQEGSHTVKFGVYQGGPAQLTETTLQIGVTETVASVSPSNGAAPLTVFLHGIAADLNDPIVLYEWDFDLAGSFTADFSSTSNPNTAHVYVFPGVYHPVFRATHLSGVMVEHPIIQGELNVNAVGSPTAIAAASQGSNALTVNFAGSGADDGTIILFEWDFDDDGVWDFSSTGTGTTSHTYSTAGPRTAALRVTDNDSNTSVDRVHFDTFAPATLEVLDDTIDPQLNELTTIRTTTTIDATVWLYIRAKNQTLTNGQVVEGRVIRTLVDHKLRPAGTYDDTWDGRDFRFEPAHPDAYFAVMEYTYPGRTDRVDLTDTTGGVQYFATRTTADPGAFSPLLNEFWEMGFTIPSASRASLYILPGGSNRTATPFDNLALGAGNYTYFWAGLKSDGTFAPPVNHLWSVNAWTLPDNAIVVQGRPDVSSLVVNPNLYSPTDRPTGEATLDIDVVLASRSAVSAKIVRADNGITVRSLVTPFLDAGPQTIVWDGRATGGERVSPGDYSISIDAVDERGNVSITRFGVCRVSY